MNRHQQFMYWFLLLAVFTTMIAFIIGAEKVSLDTVSSFSILWLFNRALIKDGIL